MTFHPSDKPYQRAEAPTIYQLLKTRAEKNADATAIAAPERLGVHGDMDVACATLSPAWPHPHLTSRTSSLRT